MKIQEILWYKNNLKQHLRAKINDKYAVTTKLIFKSSNRIIPVVKKMFVLVLVVY